MNQLHTELITVRNSLDRVRQGLAYEVTQIERHQARLDEIETEKALLAKVVGLIDRTIEVISANGINRIESTVTNGLRLVFADQEPLSLKIIKNEGKRGNSYELEVCQGDVSGPVLETFGGGIANVVALLLRVIMIKRFKLGKLMLLDEPVNNVSAQYQPMVSELLRTLVHDGGYVIFAVTHQPILALAADRVYQVYEPTSPDPDKRMPTKLRELNAEEVDSICRTMGAE